MKNAAAAANGFGFGFSYCGGIKYLLGDFIGIELGYRRMNFGKVEREDFLLSTDFSGERLETRNYSDDNLTFGIIFIL